ncbi:kinase-like protein [Wallemia mellicola]|uniref:Kinase-like protein n=1 Tax=Wallemia mellicola TaxID=1708541 RepID=A0A4T0TDN1_9BASI|nr:kinase-like protein [Wallemia mellicola]TIC45100.1 kinase-like protein [Wallemia mellicola]TIC62900.1 kinase-like protein [Wallemia mellicola]TIC65935.1 kinase-like protein [Wallemia mellicola]TIC71070.1 kinase-like protein [Wallemia mellicola]
MYAIKRGKPFEGGRDRLEETRVWKILGDIAEGVKFLHACGIWHLDLKPANIFVTANGTLRIGDFGLAVQESQLKSSTQYKNLPKRRKSSEPDADRTMLTTVLESSDGVEEDDISLYAGDLEREGDREYLAPEILRGNYSHAADIFSLGLIILEAACNIVLPGNGEPWQKLRSLDFSECPFDNLSLALVDLIKAMLDPNPENRPSAYQILQHPILNNVIKRRTKGALEVEDDGAFLGNIVDSLTIGNINKVPQPLPQASLIVTDQDDINNQIVSRSSTDDNLMDLDK